MNKNKKDDLWKEAKKKCRLNEETIRMAKEMGLNPKSLIKNIPSQSEQWKAPVHVWIREMYEKRGRKNVNETSATLSDSSHKEKAWTGDIILRCYLV